MSAISDCLYLSYSIVCHSQCGSIGSCLATNTVSSPIIWLFTWSIITNCLLAWWFPFVVFNLPWSVIPYYSAPPHCLSYHVHLSPKLFIHHCLSFSSLSFLIVSYLPFPTLYSFQLSFTPCPPPLSVIPFACILVCPIAYHVPLPIFPHCFIITIVFYSPLSIISHCLSFLIVFHPIAVSLCNYKQITQLFQAVNYTWVLHSKHGRGKDSKVCEEEYDITESCLATNRFSSPIVCHFPLSIISKCLLTCFVCHSSLSVIPHCLSISIDH